MMRDLALIIDGTWSHQSFVRVDYIHENVHASLGLAVRWREPAAFTPTRERMTFMRGMDFGLGQWLPPAMPLSAVGAELARQGF